MTDQTLVDRAVATAIENFSSSSYSPWFTSVEPLVEGAIDDAVDNLDVGATTHNIVYSLLNQRVMFYVNKWLTSAAVKGGPLIAALDTKIKSKLDRTRVDAASQRAASVISLAITKVFKDFRASEKAKYGAVVEPELSKRAETQQTTVHKNRNVSIMNAEYDVASGVLSNVNATGVPFSNVLGNSVKITPGSGPVADQCVIGIETELNMGILINVSQTAKTEHVQTKTLYLGSNTSETISFPLHPGTTSCEISLIALIEMK